MRGVIGANRHDAAASGTGAMIDLVSFRDDGDAVLARNTFSVSSAVPRLRDETEIANHTLRVLERIQVAAAATNVGLDTTTPTWRPPTSG